MAKSTPTAQNPGPGVSNKEELLQNLCHLRGRAVPRLLQPSQRTGSASRCVWSSFRHSRFGRSSSAFFRTSLSLGLLAVSRGGTWPRCRRAGARLTCPRVLALILGSRLRRCCAPSVVQPHSFPWQLTSIGEGAWKPGKRLIPHQTANLLIFIDTRVDS